MADDVVKTTTSEVVQSMMSTENAHLLAVPMTSPVVRRAVTLVDHRRAVIGLDDLQPDCNRVHHTFVISQCLYILNAARCPNANSRIANSRTRQLADATGDFASLVFVFWPFIDVFLRAYLNIYYAIVTRLVVLYVHIA